MRLICCFLLFASVVASPLYRRNETDIENITRYDFNVTNATESVRLRDTAKPPTFSMKEDSLSGATENFDDDLDSTSTDNDADYYSADEMAGIYTGSTRLRYAYAVYMELEGEKQFTKVLEVIQMETLESILRRFMNRELVSILPIPSDDQEPDIMGLELCYTSFSDSSSYETVKFAVLTDRSVIANVMESVRALTYEIARSQYPQARASSALARASSAPALLYTMPDHT